MTTLLLIRHGQTPNNVIGALDTALPGAGLTEIGHRQADDLVRRLDGEHIDRIVASEHERARLTATPLALARDLDLHQDGRFGEIEAGDLEMLTTREAADTYLTTALAWAKGDHTPRVPGGPTAAATLERFENALTEALADLADDATVVIVSHGALLRLWVTACTEGLVPEDVEERRLPNTTILRVEGRPGAWRYVSWNEPDITGRGEDPTAKAEEN